MAADPWQVWWTQDGMPGLRRLLMDEWDPLGVGDVPEAQDEYDAYVGQVGCILLEGATQRGIERYLSLVRTELIGLPPDPPRDRRAAAAVRRWWIRQQPPPMSPDVPLTAENLAAAMRASLPELAVAFQTLVDESEDDEPGITAVAALLVPEVVEAAHRADKVRLRALSTFMERMATSADQRVRNALTDGALEVIGDDRPTLERVRETMGRETLALSIAVETFWGREPEKSNARPSRFHRLWRHS